MREGWNVPFVVGLTQTFQFQAWISICWANFLCLDMFSSLLAQLHFYWCLKDLCELAHIYKAPSVKWYFTPCAFIFFSLFFLLLLVRNWQELHTEMKVIKNTYHGRKTSLIPLESKEQQKLAVCSWPSKHGPEVLIIHLVQKSHLLWIKVITLNMGI